MAPHPPPQTPDCVLSWTFLPLRESLHSQWHPSHCPHLPHSHSFLRPSLRALPLKNLSQVSSVCPPTGGLPHSGPPRHTLLPARHLELFTACTYLFQPRGQLLQEGAGFDSSLHSCRAHSDAQNRHSLLLDGGAPLSPTYPSINHFWLKEYPPHVHSI